VPSPHFQIRSGAIVNIRLILHIFLVTLCGCMDGVMVSVQKVPVSVLAHCAVEY